MNNVLLAVAFFLIFALFSLLLAPFFIDWNNYKPQLEAYASAYLQAEVQVEDRLELTILPRPTLSASNVSIRSYTNEAGGFEMREMSLRLNLPRLLQGQVVVEGLVLEEPRFTLVRTEDGLLELPAYLEGLFSDRPQQNGQAGFSAANVTVENGSFALDDRVAGRTTRLEELNLTLSLDGSRGPLRIEGGGRFDGALYTGRFSALRDDNPGLRVFFQAEGAARPFLTTLEGRLFKPLDTGFAYEGTLSIRENTRQGRLYALDARTTAGIDRAELRDVRLTVGPDGRSFDLRGQGGVEFTTDPRISLVLRTDQLVVGNGASRPSPTALVDVLRATSMPVSLSVRADSLLYNDILFNEAHLDLSTGDELWSVETLSARLRDGARFALSGEVNTAFDAFVFRGRSEIEAPSVADLRQVVELLPATFSTPLRNLRQSLRLTTDISISDDALRLSALDMQIGASVVAGDIWFRTPFDKPVLERASMSLSSLDLDNVQGAQNLFTSLREVLSPEMGRLEIEASDARLGARQLGDLAFSVSRESDVFTLSHFNLVDAEGGTLAATGDLFLDEEDIFINLSSQLKSDRLDLMTALMRPLLPEVVSQRLADLAAHSHGSDLEIETSFSVVDDALRDIFLNVEGRLGGTRINGNGNIYFTAEASELPRFELSLENNNGEILLRQLGARMPDMLEGVVPARFSLDVEGEPRDGAEVRLAFAYGETELSGEGQFVIENGQGNGRPSLLMQVTHNGSFLPYAAFIGLDEAFTPSAGEATGALEFGGDIVNFTSLEGKVGDTLFSGSVLLGRENNLPLVTGELKLDRLDGKAFLGWAMQSDIIRSEGLANPNDAIWSNGSFVFDHLVGVDAQLEIAVERLALTELTALQDFKTSLRMSGGRLHASQISASGFGGRLEGEARLASTGSGMAGFSGRVKLEDAELGQLVWQSVGRPVATGRVSLSLDLEGAGRTPVTLISGLGGDGTLSLKGATFRRLNPGAFRSIVQASVSGIELTEPRVREVFGGYLDTGALDVGDIEMPVRVASGIARLENVAFERGEERLRLNNTLDMATARLQAEWTMRSEGDLVSGGTVPEVTYVFSGPVKAPTRQLDVSALTGYLAVLALEREVRRIERLQADILERERFGRELRIFGQQRQRREREAAERAVREAEEAAERERQRQIEEESAVEEEPEAQPEMVEEEAVTEEEEETTATGTNSPSLDDIMIGFPPGFGITNLPPATNPDATNSIGRPSNQGTLEPLPLPMPQVESQQRESVAPQQNVAPQRPRSPAPSSDGVWIPPSEDGRLF